MIGADAYDVVFDIGQSTWQDLPLTAFGVALGIIVCFALLLARNRGWWLGAVFALLWCSLFFATSWLPYQRFKGAVEGGKCEQIAGVVEDYVPQPYGGHAPGDRFKVNGRPFEFSNFAVSPGYRRTVAYGGVHLAGRPVRLCAIGGDIGKLEAGRRAWPAMISSVTFQITGDAPTPFSTSLYKVTRVTEFRSHPVVWAKDFALSDFQLAVAGECRGAISELEPLIAKAADGLARSAQVLSDYRSTARCALTSSPPERSWKAPEIVRLYHSNGELTTTDPSQ